MLAKIKVKSSISLPLECKLVNKYGFRVHSRAPGQFIIFEKLQHPKKDVQVVNNLTEEQKNFLLRRCNRIIDYYPSPAKAAKQIRLRLNSLASGLNPPERIFIQEWTEQYAPAEPVE